MIVSSVKKMRIRKSARKMRLLTNLIKNKSVTVAQDQLLNNIKSGSDDMLKLLNSAIDIAKSKSKEVNNLYISSVSVDQGQAMKRRWIKSRGQATPIKKEFSHINLILSNKEENQTLRNKNGQ